VLGKGIRPSTDTSVLGKGTRPSTDTSVLGKGMPPSTDTSVLGKGVICLRGSVSRVYQCPILLLDF